MLLDCPKEIPCGRCPPPVRECSNTSLPDVRIRIRTIAHAR